MASKTCDDDSFRNSRASAPQNGRSDDDPDPTTSGNNVVRTSSSPSKNPSTKAMIAGPSANVWASKRPIIHPNTSLPSAAQRDYRSEDPSRQWKPPLQQPGAAPVRGNHVQILSRDKQGESPPSTFAAVKPNSESDQPRGKQKNKKRKPTLKTMSIGDMIPVGTFHPKKGKPHFPSSSAHPMTSQAPLNYGPSSYVRETSNVTVPQLTNHEANETSTASSIDLSNFPALPSVTPSPRENPSLQRQQHPLAANKLEKEKLAKIPQKPCNDPSGNAAALVASSQKRKPSQTTKKGLSPSAPVFHLLSNHTSTVHKHSSKQTVAEAVLEANQRDTSGEEHALLRMMQQGKFVVQNKGRQRIRPRKKKFSALKKKVLQERLQRWRELHPPADQDTDVGGMSDNATDRTNSPTTVCLYGYIDPEELEDDDEYEEIVANLQDMAVKVGPIQRIFVPRSVNNDGPNSERLAAFVDFEAAKDAAAAVACWSGLSLGGQSLEAALKQQASVLVSEDEWREWCLNGDSEANSFVSAIWEIVLDDALTEDDLEDEDCLAESVSDIKALASRFGSVVNVRVEKVLRARVYISYEGGRSTARNAALEFGSVIIGGKTITASIVESTVSRIDDDDSKDCTCVILDNVLTKDDLDDEECLEESLADIKELALRFGDVKHVCLDPPGSTSVKISYVGDHSVSDAAAAGFNGITIGGLPVIAAVVGGESQDESPSEPATAPTNDDIDKRELSGPMISKDKRIPEQFAECLRVPKIPNTGQPRKYATLVDNENVKPLLTEMLGELMRLQKRAAEDKNAKARRRLVMGLREVARGIRAHKVKLVVMANNLDEYGAIDQKLQEILDLAFEEGVPVFFEFSKRALGKAVGKSIKVAVVGVQSAEGAHQPFKKLLALAP